MPGLANLERSPARPADDPRSRSEPRPTVLVVHGPIAPEDVPELCRRVRALVEIADAGPVVCDVGALVDLDAVTVDALARLQLTARRSGGRVWLRDASAELHGLLELMGLGDVLPCGSGSGVEPSRKTEEGEQARRVEEERDSGDPTP